MTTALVVDDSPGDRRLATLALESMSDMRVLCAGNGEEALDLLLRETPDIVVTDLLMPGMDGLRFIERVRAGCPEMPIVMMTGHGSEDSAAAALRGGAASYVPKRNLLQDLAHTVATVLAAAAPALSLDHLFAGTERVELEFVVRSDPQLINPLVSRLQECLVPMGICKEEERTRIGIALSEALSNALYHGNLEMDSRLREEGHSRYLDVARSKCGRPPYCERKMHVGAKVSAFEARYSIRDEGKGFDPTRVPDPTDPANIENGFGRGLCLIHAFMDEVRHSAKGNEITIIRRAPV